MSSTFITFVVISAIGAGVAMIVAFFVMRHMRGTIELSLPKTAFAPGEQIDGSFTMTTKKAIEAKRLFVSLVGTEVSEERHGDSTRTHRREIFRDERVLEEASTIPAGHSAEYSFQLTAPSVEGSDSISGVLGDTLKIGLEIFSGDREQLEWKVEARLDAEGIDLASSKQVYLDSADRRS